MARYPWRRFRGNRFVKTTDNEEQAIARKFKESGHRGLDSKIILSCMRGRSEIDSGPLISTGYEINRRIVFVMGLLGIGRDSINVFCGLMDLYQGLAKSTYDEIFQHIHSASESMFNIVTEKAVKEE